jgi:hypothetical protein
MTNYKGNSLQLVDNSKSKSKNRKVQPSNHLSSTPRNSESQPDSTLATLRRTGSYLQTLRPIHVSRQLGIGEKARANF